MFEITRTFIQTVKAQNKFWSLNAFSTCSLDLEVFISDKLEQLEKILVFTNMQEKLEKTIF